jgi:hypothetical protein
MGGSGTEGPPMTPRDEQPTSDSFGRVRVRIRRVTTVAAVAAGGATALLGVLVATEHPGVASPAKPDTSHGAKATNGPVSNGRAPSPTRSAPLVTSGGTGH